LLALYESVGSPVLELNIPDRLTIGVAANGAGPVYAETFFAGEVPNELEAITENIKYTSYPQRPETTSTERFAPSL
jgi:hypothetical protein